LFTWSFFSVVDNAAPKIFTFSAVMLLVGRQEGHPLQPVKTEWWDVGMVMCLGQGAGLHMVQMMPLPFTISCSSKSRLVSLSGAGSPG